MQKMKQFIQGDRGRRSADKDYGDGWRGGSQVGWKATERVYAGGKDIEGVGDELDSADMEVEGGCSWPRKIHGQHVTTQSSTDIAGEGFSRKDQEKGRM